MKISAILVAAALVLATATPALANPPCQGPSCGGPPNNNCGQYCWLEYVTPISANVNVAFIDSDVKSTTLTGNNFVKVDGEIEDLHESNATLTNGVASVTSGKATAFTSSTIMANFIEPTTCSWCTPEDGISLNANVAFIDAYTNNRVNTGDNVAKMSSEIEDLCHSNATLNGGVATVVSGEGWAQTGSAIQVNLIGDWTADAQ